MVISPPVEVPVLQPFFFLGESGTMGEKERERSRNEMEGRTQGREGG